MDAFSIVIMRKDKENILSEEVATFDPEEKSLYIDSVFSVLENDKDLVHLKITTDRDMEEWEFSAVFDYYDTQKLESLGFVESVVGKEDSFNPIWEVKFFLPSNEDKLNEYVREILEFHSIELEEVYEEIKDKEDEYK